MGNNNICRCQCYYNIVGSIGFLLLENENKLDEMCNIMTKIHKYMPEKPCNINFELPNGEIYKTNDYTLHPILCGGDQLTACH